MESSDPKPLFLTGFGKSGTTLLLALMDGHPELCVFPKETRFFSVVRPELESDVERGIDRFFMRCFLRNDFGMEQKIDLPLDKQTYIGAIKRQWASRGNEISTFLRSAVLAFGDVTGQTNRKWWVEKTPLTERHTRTLSRWYPGLKMIYIVRDPRANYSTFRLWRQRVGQPINVARFSQEWQESVARSISSAEYADVLTLRYEDLAAEPKESMQRISEFLDISFDHSMLSPTLAGRHFSGNSVYGESFSGVSASSLGLWKTSLSMTEIAQLQSLLGRLMRRFSYDVEETPGGGDIIDVAWAHFLRWTYQGYSRLPEAVKGVVRTVHSRR